MSASDVTITKRGGDGAKSLPVARLKMTWEINKAGMLTGALDVDELLGQGLPVDLRGYWLRHDHPLAGSWGGVVTAAAPGSEGQIEIAAESFHVLLRRRLTKAPRGDTARPAQGSPGQLLKRALQEAESVAPTFLVAGTIDTSGKGLSFAWERMDIYDDLLPQLTDETGYQWTVSADRVLSFSKRLGTDKTGSVRLAAGLQIADYRLTHDLLLVENVVRATGSVFKNPKRGREEGYNIPKEVNASDPASISKFGIMESEHDFGQVEDAPSLKELLTQYLAEHADPAASFDGTLAVVGTEWADFREGDTVRVELGASGYQGNLTVMVRALDVDRGVLSIAGDCVEVG